MKDDKKRFKIYLDASISSVYKEKAGFSYTFFSYTIYYVTKRRILFNI